MVKRTTIVLALMFILIFIAREHHPLRLMPYSESWLADIYVILVLRRLGTSLRLEEGQNICSSYPGAAGLEIQAAFGTRIRTQVILKFVEVLA